MSSQASHNFEAKLFGNRHGSIQKTSFINTELENVEDEYKQEISPVMCTFSPHKQPNNIYSMNSNNPVLNHFKHHETYDSKEFTMGGGLPLSSRNMGTTQQMKSYTLGSSIPSPGLVDKRTSRVPNFSNIKNSLNTHSSKKAFLKKQRLDQQYRNSQEIRIETLENIIYDKLQVINDLEDKLQKQRKGHHGQSQDSQEYGETERSDALYTENSTHNFQQIQAQLEQQLKQSIEGKKKYKEKARKYKTILKKRDSEMMDLVVESKELKSALEKEQRKHQETKNKLKNEVVMIKDDLQNQARKQQVEFNFDIEQLRQEVIEKDRKINESKIQIDNLRKEMERFKEISFQNQNSQLQSLRTEYEVQLKNKDDLKRHMEGELEKIRQQNSRLQTIEREQATSSEQLVYYKEQVSNLRDKIENLDDQLTSKEKQIKKLQACQDKLKGEKEEVEEDVQKLLDENQTLITKYKKEIEIINEKHEEKLKEIEIEHQKSVYSQKEKQKSFEVDHQSKLVEKDKELLLIKGEILKLKEEVEENETNHKKQVIKYEKQLFEQENQIKSLNMIIEDLKREERDKISVEQRVEGKNKQINLLKEQIDSLKEDLLMYKLNLGKQTEVTTEDLEKELLKLCHQNKELKKELADLKYKNEDLVFKQARSTQRTQKEYEKENKILKENVIEIERKLNEKSVQIRKLQEESRRSTSRENNVLQPTTKHHFKNLSGF